MKTVLTIMILSAVAMAVLGLFRVPFAIRFWRRAQVAAFAYIAVILVLAAYRIWVA